MSKQRLHVAAYFPNHCGGRSHSHACLAICEHIQDAALSVELHVPTSEPAGRRSFTREAVGRWGPLSQLACRLDRGERLRPWLQRKVFRRALARADAAYLWAATPEPIFEDVKRAGLPIFLERINTHRATARPILDEAYRRLGIAPAHGISDSDMAAEGRKLLHADFVFVPSPIVRASLMATGVPATKILSSSYGWSPERLQVPSTARVGGTPFRVLFLGTVSIRKGAHLLLEAWAEARLGGTLELVGPVLPEITRVSSAPLAQPDVAVAGYQYDVSAVYARADLFAFPTLEEGSPLVVYEAMAHGLPILTTPMGAGDVVRDGIEGVVLDPYDRDGWVGSLRRLAADLQLRLQMGAAARARVHEYTWAKVGARRRALFLAALAV